MKKIIFYLLNISFFINCPLTAKTYDLPNKSFYFLRHGETNWNRDKISMGSKDIPLNANGIQQTEMILDTLSALGIEKIVSTPLKRARLTAEIIQKKLNVPLEIIDDLREYNWGILEGKNLSNSTWREDWKNGAKVEGAETYPMFRNRIHRGLVKALDSTKKTLIVGHGGTYWAIRDFMKLPHINLLNCSLLHHIPPSTSAEKWSACFVK